MSMTIQPSRTFPATASQGNPVPAAAISSQARGSGQVQGPADGRPARWRPEQRGQVREQADVAHARSSQRDRGGHRDERDSPVEQRRGALFLQRAGQQAGQADLVGGLAEQDRARVADQALSVRGDLQGMVPPVMLHGEERSGLEVAACGNR
jgi:hypothetical protein